MLQTCNQTLGGRRINGGNQSRDDVLVLSVKTLDLVEMILPKGDRRCTAVIGKRNKILLNYVS